MNVVQQSIFLIKVLMFLCLFGVFANMISTFGIKENEFKLFQLTRLQVISSHHLSMNKNDSNTFKKICIKQA